jgi:capsular exopolysaccharide synthesis family protein
MDQVETQQSPDLRRHLRVLRRRGWLIALVTVVSIGIALALTAMQKPVYQASMSLVVGQGGGAFQPQYGPATQPFVQTVANLFTSNVVAQTTAERLGLKLTPQQLLGRTQVTTTPDNSVIGVTYDSSDRNSAVTVLGEMGKVFTTLISQKLAPGARPSNKITATVFDPPHLSPGTVSPHPNRNLAIAAVLGLAVGVLLAFVWEGLDSRIRSRRDAERWFGAPVLATLPRNARRLRPGEHLTIATRPTADAVGMVRASLQYLGGGPAGPVITITSALPREGKTMFAANLGVGLARSGNQVICVDADLRHPRLCEYLTGQVCEHGLADVLTQSRTLDQVLVEGPSLNGHAHAGGGLRVLPAGITEGKPADLLTAANVLQLVESLRGRADYVIIDTPSLLEVGDAFPFARAADNVIVVASQGHTTRETAEDVRTTLERLDVSRAGVVLVGASD